MARHRRPATEAPARRPPWNRRKLVGAKPPLKLSHVWSILTKLHIECRKQDLALFNLAIDSKWRGSDVAAIRVEDVAKPSKPLAPDDVLVAPLVCGICGTDLHEYICGPIVTPATPHIYTNAVLPQILGHEFSASVLDVGSGSPMLSRVTGFLFNRSFPRVMIILVGAACSISAKRWAASA